MSRNRRLFPGLLVPVLLFTPACSFAQNSLMGIWAFDAARKSVYEQSIRAKSTGPFSEIAAAMGQVGLETTEYELGFDESGPFFAITDEESGRSTREPVEVRKAGRELLLVGKDSGDRYRLKAIDPTHLDLVDEQKRVTIPLRKR